jgi:hypothetical protein
MTSRPRRAGYVLMLAIVLLGLDTGLAIALTDRASQEFYLDRLGDTMRFASLAPPILRGGPPSPLREEVVRYDTTYGIAVAVVARDGHPVLASRAGIDVVLAAVPEPVDTALAGRPAPLTQIIWPWQDEPLVVAVPVIPDGDVAGAVVTISPTLSLRRQTGWRLAALSGVAALAVLGAVVLVGRPATRSG